MAVPDRRSDDRHDLHVAMVWPEIPWNTGNVARSCLAFGAQLHLVEPIGFSLDAREVKRAGLDYWEHVLPIVHRDLDALMARLPELGEPWLLAPEAERSLYEAELAPRSVFLLGCESTGLPASLLEAYESKGRVVAIRHSREIVRSLNVSTAAAVAMAEFRRRFPCVATIPAS